MDALNSTYILKEESIFPTKRYIGANDEKFQMENDKELWSMHYVGYLHGSIKNVDDILSKDHGEIIKKYVMGVVTDPDDNIISFSTN